MVSLGLESMYARSLMYREGTSIAMQARVAISATAMRTLPAWPKVPCSMLATFGSMKEIDWPAMKVKEM